MVDRQPVWSSISPLTLPQLDHAPQGAREVKGECQKSLYLLTPPITRGGQGAIQVLAACVHTLNQNKSQRSEVVSRHRLTVSSTGSLLFIHVELEMRGQQKIQTFISQRKAWKKQPVRGSMSGFHYYSVFFSLFL